MPPLPDLLIKKIKVLLYCGRHVCSFTAEESSKGKMCDVVRDHLVAIWLNGHDSVLVKVIFVLSGSYLQIIFICRSISVGEVTKSKKSFSNIYL